MTTLDELQHQFQAHLLVGGRPLPGLVVDGGRLDAAARLEIYREAYGLRLIEALQADYRGLHHLLGDQRFAEVARNYILAHPSKHRSVRWFGAQLPEFLAEDASHGDIPVLAELATFDWAVSCAFDAGDVTPIGLEAMAGVPQESWPTLRLAPHPSARRLDLTWNVVAVRKAADLDEEPEPPRKAEWPVPWIVWRKQLAAKYRSMPVDEAWAWGTAAGGGTFADICEGLCEWVDPQNVGPRAAEHLKTWIVDEMIAEVSWDAC